jgi:hypothetical protein
MTSHALNEINISRDIDGSPYLTIVLRKNITHVDPGIRFDILGCDISGMCHEALLYCHCSRLLQLAIFNPRRRHSRQYRQSLPVSVMFCELARLESEMNVWPAVFRLCDFPNFTKLSTK